jgi:hypothetical protein
MLDRTSEQFDLALSRLVADASYGSAEMLGWLLDQHGIQLRSRGLTSRNDRTELFRAATSPTMPSATSMSLRAESSFACPCSR